MAMLQPIRRTADEYFRYDEERVELIDGEFLVTAAPTPRHQLIVRNLLRALDPQILALKLGELIPSPVDCRLDDTNVVQPDLVFIASGNLGRLKKYIDGPPDVAFEVLSENDPQRDLRTKKRLYHERRVREYWILDPEKETITVLVWQREGWREHGVFPAGQAASSVVIAGVRVATKEIFAK